MLVRLALATVFISGLYVATGAGILQLSYLLMGLLYVVIALTNRRAGISRGIGVLFVVLLVTSLVSSALTADDYGVDFATNAMQFSVKLALACFFLVFYYSVYLLAGSSVRRLFTEYLTVAGFFAALGILQQAVYVAAHVDIFGFLATGAKDYGTYLGVSGLSVEPAFYACALLPAGAYYAAEAVWRFRIPPRGIIIIAAIIFSTSSLGYLGLAFAVVISLVFNFSASRSWILVATTPVMIFAMLWMFQQEFFQVRFHDTLALLRGGGVSPSLGANISSYSLAVNSSMTAESFRSNVGLGPGFGMYNVVFDHYISGYQIPAYREFLPGRGSATSFLLRITAELGVVGLAIVAWCGHGLLRGIRNKANRPIAVAYIATFLVILLRMGEYYANGVLLVLLMSQLLKMEAQQQPEDASGTRPASDGPALSQDEVRRATRLPRTTVRTK